MSNTMKNELNKIVLGSMDFYVVAFTGTVPEDTEIEKDENMIGRTKTAVLLTTRQHGQRLNPMTVKQSARRSSANRLR